MFGRGGGKAKEASPRDRVGASDGTSHDPPQGTAWNGVSSPTSHHLRPTVQAVIIADHMFDPDEFESLTQSSSELSEAEVQSYYENVMSIKAPMGQSRSSDYSSESGSTSTPSSRKAPHSNHSNHGHDGSGRRLRRANTTMSPGAKQVVRPAARPKGSAAQPNVATLAPPRQEAVKTSSDGEGTQGQHLGGGGSLRWLRFGGDGKKKKKDKKKKKNKKKGKKGKRVRIEPGTGSAGYSVLGALAAVTQAAGASPSHPLTPLMMVETGLADPILGGDAARETGRGHTSESMMSEAESSSTSTSDDAQTFDDLKAMFKALEREFRYFDLDEAGFLSYAAFDYALCLRGFREEERLGELFEEFDVDHSATLDFAEFLQLMYFWADISRYSTLFEKLSARRIERGTASLRRHFPAMARGSKITRAEAVRFNRHVLGEPQPFFDQVWSEVVAALVAQATIVNGPTSIPPIMAVVPFFNIGGMSAIGGGGGGGGGKSRLTGANSEANELTVNQFLYFLYKLVHPNGRYRNYATSGVVTTEDSYLQDARSLLGVMFSTLEEDFARFDDNKDNRIDMRELTMGVRFQDREQRVDLVRRLQYLHRLVDLDNSGDLDYLEFIHLMYLFMERGAYSQIVENSRNPKAVFSGMLFLRHAYVEFDTDGDGRLSRAEMRLFFTDYIGEIPASFDESFDRVHDHRARIGTAESPTTIRPMADMPQTTARPSSRHGSHYGDRGPPAHVDAVMDFVSFIHILYFVIVGDEAHYLQRPAVTTDPPRALLTHRESPRVVEEPLPPRERWDDFDPALLEQVKRIGHGAYGEVYRCRYGQWTVAAKYIKARPGVTPEAVVREFNKEAELLSMVDHANIVYMYGAWCHLPDLCLVTELCPHGSLFDILQRQMKRLHPELMARIALDVARAMAAIHAAKIIHRDLKSLNVLLGHGYKAKVCDFGLSKVRSATIQSTHHHPVGTSQWMAPEIVAAQGYTYSVDVYSFAIVCWELGHSKIPYTDMEPMQIIFQVVQGLRPEIDVRHCPPFLANLMSECWEANPHQRPTFPAIVERLETTAATITKEHPAPGSGRRTKAARSSANAAMFQQMGGNRAKPGNHRAVQSGIHHRKR